MSLDPSTSENWSPVLDKEMGFTVMCARGPWEAGSGQRIASSGAQGIKLSLSQGWDGVVTATMLDEMESLLPHIESFELYHPGATGMLDRLSAILANLELVRLCIQAPKGLKVNLSRLTSLRVLKAFWSAGLSGLETCTNLQTLNVVAYPFNDLEPVGGNGTSLRSLSVTSRRLESVHGIKHLAGLIELDLHGCPHLKSISEVAHHPTLTQLRISACNALASILTEVSSISTLRHLEVENCRLLSDEWFLLCQRSDLPYTLYPVPVKATGRKRSSPGRE